MFSDETQLPYAQCLAGGPTSQPEVQQSLPSRRVGVGDADDVRTAGESVNPFDVNQNAAYAVLLKVRGGVGDADDVWTAGESFLHQSQPSKSKSNPKHVEVWVMHMMSGQQSCCAI